MSEYEAELGCILTDEISVGRVCVIESPTSTRCGIV